jgi:hypothetical protein
MEQSEAEESNEEIRGSPATAGKGLTQGLHKPMSETNTRESGV